MFEGKNKAVTFSYDDGVRQDIKLISLLDKYGMKATFNLNSKLFGVQGDDIRRGTYIRADRLNSAEIKSVYQNHEVAAHTLTHPNLTELTKTEIIEQVKCDQYNLEELIGKQIFGMAYPGGGINYNSYVSEVIREHTKIKYARTTVNTDVFNKQSNLLELKPNVYHIMEPERLFEVGRKFLDSSKQEEQVLFIWGHSFELDIGKGWELLEEFLKMIANQEDVFYGTNSDVFL